MCDLFGRSRQAYYQRNKYNYKEEVKEEILLQLVEKQRELMHRIGGRKLLELIQPRLPPELSIGRDSFFDFLRDKGLLVGKRRRRIKTTYSNHWLRKYPNLIKEFNNYAWSDKRSSTPIDNWNHGIDPLRYGLAYTHRRVFEFSIG